MDLKNKKILLVDDISDTGKTFIRGIQYIKSLGAENIKTAIMSDGFSDFLDSVMWGNFGIDRRLFSHIRNDFWKEFILEKTIKD